MDPSKYHLSDFLEDDSFRKWASEVPSAEFDQWQKHFAASPDIQKKMLEARQLIRDLKEVQALPADRELEEKIWRSVQPGRSRFRILSLRRMAASVAILVGLGLGYYLYTQPARKEEGLSREIAEVNDSEQVRTVVLSDGTQVELSAGSRIYYGESFNQADRRVILEGEAFFDVARNPEKPFLVISNGLVTRVLGTSFTVSSNEKEVSVSVKTGRVEVISQENYEHLKDTDKRSSATLVLKPNQMAVFSKKEASLTRSLVADPLIVNPSALPATLSFDNTPAAEVFERLANAYNIEIIYDPDTFSQCRLTVSLEDEQLFEKLEVICKTFNAEYRLSDAKILIEGKGCKF